MHVEDKKNAQPDREEGLDKSSSARADEVHIPDYVVLDFGFPERTQTGVNALA